MALLSQSLMLLLAVGASLGQCPSREDLLPCSCTLPVNSWDQFKIKVFCWKVDDVDDVRRALQSVKGIQEVDVEFKDSHLGSVPSDLFKGLHVTELTFDQCVLNRIGDVGRSALEGLEDSIKKMSVKWSFSKDNPLTFLNVSRLRAIEYLSIGTNNVNEVGDEWFAEGPANLKELHMSVNEITRLGDKAFAHLTNIKKLWISHNKIETVTRSIFPSPAVYLETISLRGNKIASLPVDLFSNMPQLTSFFIGTNSIQHLPEETWKSVWSRLRILDLIGIPLNCDADIEWTLKETRPKFLFGKCVSPDDRKGKDLKEIIDEKQKNQ